jgi:hypothetical protein
MLLLEGKASGVGRFPALHYARSALYSHRLTDRARQPETGV